MTKKTSAYAYPHQGFEIESHHMVFYFGLSILFHLVFIGAMVYLPEAAPRRRMPPGAISVSLVSLPGPPAPAPAAKAAARPVSMPEPEVKTIPKEPVIETPPPQPKPLPEITTPKKTVSLAPEKPDIKPKESLKKKTQDREKMIEQALTKVEKKVETARSDSVQQALERLKKQVEQTESAAASGDPAAKGAIGAAGTGVPGATGSGQRALELIDIYKIEVAFQVERNWAFSQQLAGNGKILQTSLVFKVLPSGEITDIRFTERSGNAYLDDSAYKAVVKANPVPPHPAGIRTPYVTVALRFTPEGLRK